MIKTYLKCIGIANSEKKKKVITKTFMIFKPPYFDQPSSCIALAEDFALIMQTLCLYLGLLPSPNCS